MDDLSLIALAILGFAAFCTGINKLAIPGLGVLFVVLVPMVVPAKLSTGYILPFLIFGDIIAILYWRSTVIWRVVRQLIPAMVIGVGIGYSIMGRIDDDVYGKVLGGIVLILMLLDWARIRFHLPIPMGNKAVGFTLGCLAGIMTMLANAAGPVTMLYLLAMNITKEELVGTTAWIFFFINAIKVPFSISLGLISLETLKVNMMMFPLVIIGAFVGVWAIKRIPTKAFAVITRVFAFLGGVKLFF